MQNKSRALLLAGLMIVMTVLLVFAVAAQEESDDVRFVGQVIAPAFPAGLDWLNVAEPLRLQDLAGKVVVLDFWTYGCINCIHMIPILEELEQKYAEELIIIGVHSAKFENESQTENIRQIVQRYNVGHPVINDLGFQVWGAYGVRAWPTFAIIDPRGGLVAMQPGEVPFEAFDQYIGSMIAYYDGLGTDEINREPIEFAPEGADDPGTPLLFPGALLADEAGERLFITDSNHHRIVIADLNSYEVLEIIGSSERGTGDGDYATAQFNQPQGLALSADGQTLYVADTNNHLIRAVDLGAQTVRTIAGTGRMGTSAIFFDAQVSDPLSFDLRSPWDLALSGNDQILYIAHAGTHQIYQLDLSSNVLQASVGNGREAQLNGTLSNSELAQPSGLFYRDGLLYFADSESSTVRVADYASNSVGVIAGTLEDSLFDFGDQDGPVGESRLQHALGVTGSQDGSLIYIADTYNNKIRVTDTSTLVTTTLFGAEAGLRDGDSAEARFFEPGGIDYALGRLYVADTNNHAIRVIDLEAGLVSTISFPNVALLEVARRPVTVVGGNQSAGEVLALDEQTLAPGEGSITLAFDIPEAFKINPLTRSTVQLRSSDSAVLALPDEATLSIETPELLIPLTLSEGSALLSLDVTLYYCEAENERYCLIDSVLIELPLRVSDAADPAAAARIERRITPPEVYSEGIF